MDSEDSTRFLLCHPSFQVGYNKLSFLFAYHDFSPAFGDFSYYITFSFAAAYFCGIAIGRLFSTIHWCEYAAILAVGLLLGGTICLLGELIWYILSYVMATADLAAFWWTGALMIGITFLGLTLLLGGEHMLCRTAQKAARMILPGLGFRLYGRTETELLAEDVVAELAQAREHIEQAAKWCFYILFSGSCILMLECSMALLSGTAGSRIGWLVFWCCVWGVLCFVRSFCAKTECRPAHGIWQWVRDYEVNRRLGLTQERTVPVVQILSLLLMPILLSAIVVLLIPLLYLGEKEGHSPAVFLKSVVLYLPCVLLLLRNLITAGQTAGALQKLCILFQETAQIPDNTAELPAKGSILELKHITVTYPGRREPVLKDISLKVYGGESIGILGRTGAGKTTLARLIQGQCVPTSGEIYYGENQLLRYNPRSLQRRIAWETGSDICLLNELSRKPDGRTKIVFSVHKKALLGCNRIFELVNGTLRTVEPERDMSW